MSVQRKLIILVLLGGALGATAFGVASYQQMIWLANQRLEDTASNLISRSVQMFMVGTDKFHEEFNAAETEADRQAALQDWNRSITAVDLAVIHDFGEDKPRVRLIGDEEIFGIAPLGGAGVAIKSDFERRAASEIAGGAAEVREVSDDYLRIAMPLPSDAHPGCAECHGVPVDDHVVLGTLNAYVPRAAIIGEARLAAGIAIGGVVTMILALAGGIAWLIATQVVRPIKRIAGGLDDGANHVSGSAQQVAGSSQELTNGANAQAQSLQRSGAALEEMASQARTNAESAQQANQKMGESKTIIAEATDAMHQASQAMGEVSDASEQIKKIIKVIEEIAFQTNLLSLNAAVEAARAGEHGKGFAVVADEVRNLAMRAADAARETGELIEQTVERVGRGVTLNESAGEGFTRISAAAEDVARLIDQISTASHEQAQGVEQVNVAVGEIDKVTQRNATGAAESAAAAEEMATQAQSVKGLVGDLLHLIRGRDAE